MAPKISFPALFSNWDFIAKMSSSYVGTKKNKCHFLMLPQPLNFAKINIFKPSWTPVKCLKEEKNTQKIDPTFLSLAYLFLLYIIDRESNRSLRDNLSWPYRKASSLRISVKNPLNSFSTKTPFLLFSLILLEVSVQNVPHENMVILCHSKSNKIRKERRKIPKFVNFLIHSFLTARQFSGFLKFVSLYIFSTQIQNMNRNRSHLWDGNNNSTTGIKAYKNKGVSITRKDGKIV